MCKLLIKSTFLGFVEIPIGVFQKYLLDLNMGTVLINLTNMTLSTLGPGPMKDVLFWGQLYKN